MTESGAKGDAKLIELLEHRRVCDVVNVTPPDGMDPLDWAAHSDAWISAFDSWTTSGGRSDR